jgi:hypothetical protein
MQRISSGFKKNWKMYLCLLLLAIYVLMLNILTPYVADDFVYMFSFRDGTRITSVLQIFPSLYQHYMNDIGRIVPHFFAQLFLMGPKWIFNIANTLMFVALAALMLHLTGAGKRFSVILWFLIPVLFWQFVPNFGQVFLWEDGSFNYLWSFTFAVIYLIPYVRLLLGGKEGWFTDHAEGKFGWKIGLCIYTFFFGNYSESVSFSVIFVSFLMLLLVCLWEKQWKIYTFYLVPIICGALGYLLILASPGESSHMASKGLGEILGSLIRIFETFYTSQKTLLVLWAVLMVAAVYCRSDRRRIALAVFLFLISLCSVALLAFGTYLEDRAMAAGSVFLIFSIVTLLQALRPSGTDRGCVIPAECVVLCIGMYFIAGSLLNIWNGSYDIYDTSRRNAEREAYIMEQADAGATELTVSQIEPATTYCAKYGLADIYSADQEGDWLNKAIAKYYGLDMIYGE